MAQEGDTKEVIQHPNQITVSFFNKWRQFALEH
ncbi:hypothetical protein J2S00_003997 [Caldalkalibacillus uzonensis]|uniref:Uncharacterized protein n=1 Tax=Caldalkalibacillus uzonensis TaxID=353224 RepID=A0ABU0CYC5_9BACI|nr:hypothetical protein [Caldalkalibacillus uzonensis]